MISLQEMALLEVPAKKWLKHCKQAMVSLQEMALLQVPATKMVKTL